MRARIALTALLGVIAALLAAGPAGAAFPGRNGEIAFRSEVNPSRTDPLPGFRGIEAVRPDGSGRRLVCTCDTSFDIAFSPDGRSLAFDGEEPGLWVIGADGTGRRRIQLSGYVDIVVSVAWSPGASRLLIADLYGRDRFFKLFTTTSRGTGGLKPITRKGQDEAVSWSTNGWIAFQRRAIRDGGVTDHRDIWVMRARGGGLRRLTRKGGGDPDFSPHGKWIAFERRGEIYVVQRAGGGLRRLTEGGGADPAFSPDGRFVAFVRGGDVWTVRLDGSGARRVAERRDAGGPDRSSMLGNPTWQPLR
jgi:TolB protein